MVLGGSAFSCVEPAYKGQEEKVCRPSAKLRACTAASSGQMPYATRGGCSHAAARGGSGALRNSVVSGSTSEAFRAARLRLDLQRLQEPGVAAIGAERREERVGTKAEQGLRAPASP
jgi:hypothetical protein